MKLTSNCSRHEAKRQVKKNAPDKISLSLLEKNFTVLETQCLEEARRVACQNLTEQLRQLSEGEKRLKIKCACGKTMRCLGKRKRVIITLVGDVVFRRNYYYCDICGCSLHPLDQQLKLSDSRWSDQVCKQMTMLAVEMPFDRAAYCLESVGGVRVSAKGVQLVVEREGKKVDGILYLKDLSPQPPLRTHEWLVIMSDGAHFPTLLKDEKWKEMKCAVVYVLGREQEAIYISYVGHPQTLGEDLRAAAYHLGLRDTRQVLFVGDGAPWLWNMLNKFFPDAYETLDFYHLSEHINDCAKILYGEGNKSGARWAERLCHIAKHDGGKILLSSLKNCKRRETEALRDLIRYVENNRNRMTYPENKEKGFPIGSGRVESACKQIVGARLKGAGMRWSLNGAQWLSNMRCLRMSYTWEAYWDRKFARAA